MPLEGSESMYRLSSTPEGAPFNAFSCFVIGTDSLLIQCAEILLQKHHHIYGVISSEPLIADWAREHDISLIEPGPNLADILRQQGFDYLFSIANLSIIPDEILVLPGQGAINFHDGPLPRYAGLHATSWALINREQTYGITWHRMRVKVDKGDILKQRSVVINESDTAFTLNGKCYGAAIDSFAELVDELASDRVAVRKQKLAEHTYFAKFKRPPAACTISWSQPAEDISALIRALNFGPYANPLGLPKLLIGGEILIVPEIDVLDASTPNKPGTITAIDSSALTVATASKDVVLRKLFTVMNQPISIADFVTKFDLSEGSRLPELDQDTAGQLTTLNRAVCRHEEFWRKRLAALESIEIPYAHRSRAHIGPLQYATVSTSIPAAINTLLVERADAFDRDDVLVAAFAVYLARLSGTYTFDLGFCDDTLQREFATFQHFFAMHVPLRVELDPSQSFETALGAIQAQRALLSKHHSYARDMILRYSELSSLQACRDQSPLPIIVQKVEGFDDFTPLSGSELTLLLAEDGSECYWVYDTAVLDSSSIATMQSQFTIFVQNITAHRHCRISDISLLTEAERHRLLVEWNDTRIDYPVHLCIHELFETQVEQTPDAVAVVFEHQPLTYRQLNSRANQLAHYLRTCNVGPETLVGIYMERSLDILVGLLGILKAGGAYVPLDPTYPAERIAFMIEDARVPVLLTQERLVDDLSACRAQVVCVDTDWDTIAAEREENVQSGVVPDNLSYVIYTSGSTGKPKGVMVCHRNVVNFFTGMDECIPHTPPGVWLAVTSLSFDISVLELFWTLARGFKVILYADTTHGQTAAAPMSPHAHKDIAFSLFYFASDENERGNTDKYTLLLEGAKFADKHGFAAVWTPERHFHAFGGLYPNPSVTSAAIAAITEHIGIRAGSCVLPLHHPIRVAEEWALVDNMSRGRVGISFAAGWQPNDFVLRPENHASSKDVMFRDIEVVRQLWRGEAVHFPGPHGRDVAVRTLPRPVQADLPIWITIAGNPETFRMAGARGFNILTHLLGQTIDELAEKLAIYRQAWVDNGHSGKGHVTLMLHTFIGDDIETVREIVRKPMTDYLRSSVGLIKEAAWNFPTFKQRAEATGKSPLEIFETEEIPEEDMETLLTFAFERYFETSGLFGTPRTCLQMVHTLKALDIDEIACLIDFGVSSETVLEHLAYLKTLKERVALQQRVDEYSIPSLIKRHQVTHMQCTPSMASMLTLDEESRAALRRLQTFMVGGEAFPGALAAELTQLVAGNILNMYGPTETTIWSSTYTLSDAPETVPIGRPIANTDMYILDNVLQPVPVGVAGELFIGGDGVVREYLDRPELTAERFVKDPFRHTPEARMYRTGDLAHYRPDGNIEFLGRIDHQVKIRGYRIELGEIETVLAQHAGVQGAVVVASEQMPDEKRLLAYVVAAPHAPPSSNELSSFLKERLPEYMIPSTTVFLDAFPLTPNGKIDRRALPAPDQARPQLDKTFVAPSTPIEEVMAGIWAEVIGLERVGIHDNFFELGGHSLLAARLVAHVREAFRAELPLHSLFEAPTIAGLSRVLMVHEAQPGQTEKIARILKRIDNMSAAEVGQILQERKRERGVV